MIGIFDSGYGGLTVFKPVAEKFLEYDFIYLGDNARAPYGSRQEETIYEYTKEAVDWLFKAGCELVILACNTASSQALRKIQQEYLPANFPDKRVLGVLIPMAEAIANLDGKIGILATETTVKSGAYLREIQKLGQHRVSDIVQIPAPLLVPLIEEGMASHSATREILKTYLEPFKKEEVKNIVLGCTHYPFIKHLIQEEMSASASASLDGPEAKIFDSPSIIPSSLKDYLARHPEIETKLSRFASRRFVTTGDPEKFAEFAKNFLEMEIRAERVIL